MSSKIKHTLTRREFVRHSSLLVPTAIGAPGLVGAPALLKYYNKPHSVFKGVQIGVITYSFRSLPDQSAEATLQYVLDCGINAIELMGEPAESFVGIPENPVDRRAYFTLMRQSRNEDTFTDDQKKELEEMRTQMKVHNEKVVKWRSNVAMDRFEKMGKMYKNAGVQIYGFKPRAFGSNNADEEIDYGFRAAKALGANHVTLEHPSNDAHTLKLGKLAKKHQIYVAYHGHDQQTPVLWDTALGQSDFNKMNLDLGHYIAAGNKDAIELIKTKHSSMSSMHVKDRQTPENGKKNMPFGEGDTPIVQVLQLMRDQHYTFPATIELEYDIPEDSNPVKEVLNCLNYCKEALEAS